MNPKFQVTESVNLGPKIDGTGNGDPSSGCRGRGSVYAPWVAGWLRPFVSRKKSSGQTSESELHDSPQHAIVACGFADELEAMRAVLNLLGEGLCSVELIVCKPVSS